MSKFLATLPITTVGALFALCLASCSSQNGKTLTVSLGDSARVAVVATVFNDAAAVNYRGSRQLGYSWTVKSQPAGGGNVQFSPVAGTTAAGSIPVTITFGTPGTYVIGIDVFEIGGSVTGSAQTTYVVNSSSG